MADELKLRAAEAALDYVENGMRLGLGTGATASAFVRLLGNRVAAGLDIVAVATSGGTARLADECRIRMTTLDETPELDLAIDGADEIGPGLAMIKGGGGALLREKIVAAAARRMIVIADEAKRVKMLGAFPLPIEVAGFGHAATVRAIEKAAAALGLEGAIRRRMRDGAAYLTDGGNGIVDASFGRIPDPEALANRLAGIPGVIENGLFLGYAEIALVASADGVTTITA